MIQECGRWDLLWEKGQEVGNGGGKQGGGSNHQLPCRLPLRSRRRGRKGEYVLRGKASGREGGLQVGRKRLEQSLKNLTEKENWNKSPLVLRKTQVQSENMYWEKT